MIQGHVKGVHDVSEVVLFWLMDLTLKKFISSLPLKSNGVLVPMY